MTDPMTDARLAEIERRWSAVGLTSWAAFCDEQEYPNTNIVAFKHRTQLICSIPGADKRDSVPVFIESAIEDVPALVAEVRRLREENARLRSDVWRVVPDEDGDGGEKWREFAADRDAEVGQYTALVAKLRAAHADSGPGESGL